jgi:hypothetical protein
MPSPNRSSPARGLTRAPSWCSEAIMQLYEFIEGHTDEILRCCVAKLRQANPERDDIDLLDGLGVILDEIRRALRRHAGLPDQSPLPGSSEAAANVGEQRLHRGYPIVMIASSFGSLSDAVGELSGNSGLSFAADDYNMFNLCVDAGIATAIERYWQRSRELIERESSERVGALAHELRNALASGHMAFNMLRSHRVDIDSRTADVVERSFNRMRSLVNQTMLAVRLDFPFPQKLERRRIPVRTFLRHLADDAVLERRIRLRCEVADDPVLDVDESMLASAVSNLLQNAIKFTRPEGKVVLRACEVRGRVVIEVQDECGGLPPGPPERLFAPFEQAGGDRRGIGLGLTITREAVHKAGGTVGVRDLPGRGCVFSIEFPKVHGH